MSPCPFFGAAATIETSMNCLVPIRMGRADHSHGALAAMAKRWCVAATSIERSSGSAGRFTAMLPVKRNLPSSSIHGHSERQSPDWAAAMTRTTSPYVTPGRIGPAA